MKHLLAKALAAGVLLLPLLMTVRGQAAEEISGEKILAAGEDWQDKYDQYDPPADILQALKPQLGTGMKIDVYLGLWCSDSRNNVPPFIKMLESLGAGVPVRYFNVPRKAGEDSKYFVEELQVERVPTFIFYRNGEEIGRIIENPQIGLAEDLLDILYRGVGPR